MEPKFNATLLALDMIDVTDEDLRVLAAKCVDVITKRQATATPAEVDGFVQENLHVTLNTINACDLSTSTSKPTTIDLTIGKGKIVTGINLSMNNIGANAVVNVVPEGVSTVNKSTIRYLYGKLSTKERLQLHIALLQVVINTLNANICLILKRSGKLK